MRANEAAFKLYRCDAFKLVSTTISFFVVHHGPHSSRLLSPWFDAIRMHSAAAIPPKRRIRSVFSSLLGLACGCARVLTLSGALQPSTPFQRAAPPRPPGAARNLHGRGNDAHGAPDFPHFLLVGGLGRVGSAAAAHLLLREPAAHVTLVGRRRRPETSLVFRGDDGDEDPLLRRLRDDPRVSIVVLETSDDFWADDDEGDDELQQLVASADCLLHTAGPYYPDQAPTVLRRVLRADRCRAYVDVADPLPLLRASLSETHQARARRHNKTCLVAAGAFPGMSNVLALEAAAAALAPNGTAANGTTGAIRDVYFQYVTAGLGGSGPVNLYITNLGFGEPLALWCCGRPRNWTTLSGRLLGTVDFELGAAGLDDATGLVGRRQVFAWPFPEAATVPEALNVTGDSVAAMGTAPDVWNGMLDLLVRLVPRFWWRSRRFSQFMADFSEPLVKLSDAYLKLRDTARGTGETHAMRIDVARRDGGGITVAQGHESFRLCVGQSCAEFAIDCLQYPDRPGVYLPEQRYRDPLSRRRIVKRLTTTPGTIWYSGPVPQTSITGPTNLVDALKVAGEEERKHA